MLPSLLYEANSLLAHISILNTLGLYLKVVFLPNKVGYLKCRYRLVFLSEGRFCQRMPLYTKKPPLETVT